MTEEPIHASYTPTHEEIWVTQRHAARYVFSRGHRIRFWAYISVIGGVIIGFLQFLYSDEMQAMLARHLGQPLAGLAPAILAFILVAGGRARFGRWAQKFFNKGLDQRAPLPALKFTAGENRLEWTGKHSSSWLEYEAIDRLLLTPTTLGIMTGGSAISLPVHAFNEGEDIGSIVNFIFNRLSAEAKDLSLKDERIRKYVWWAGPLEDG